MKKKMNKNKKKRKSFFFMFDFWYKNGWSEDSIGTKSRVSLKFKNKKELFLIFVLFLGKMGNRKKVNGRWWRNELILVVRDETVTEMETGNTKTDSGYKLNPNQKMSCEFMNIKRLLPVLTMGGGKCLFKLFFYF